MQARTEEKSMWNYIWLGEWGRGRGKRDVSDLSVTKFKLPLTYKSVWFFAPSMKWLAWFTCLNSHPPLADVSCPRNPIDNHAISGTLIYYCEWKHNNVLDRRTLPTRYLICPSWRLLLEVCGIWWYIPIQPSSYGERYQYKGCKCTLSNCYISDGRKSFLASGHAHDYMLYW